MYPGTAPTAAVLAQLSVGDRLWYTLCPDLEVHESRLTLTSLAEDPDGSKMDAQTVEEVGSSHRVLRGLASVGPAGTLTLGGPLVQEDDLQALAEWVAAQWRAHPSLLRLKSTTLVRVTGTGSIEARLDRPDLWRFLPSPEPVMGSLAWSARRLEALQPPSSAWFWFTDRGAGGGPALLVTLQGEDPDGEQLATLVEAVRGEGMAAFGTARRGADGRLHLISDTVLDSVHSLLRRGLEAHPDTLAVLDEARLMRTGSDGIVDAADGPAGPSLRRSLLALEGLAPGDSAPFLFATEIDGGRQLFVGADTDTDTLDAIAAHACKSGRHVVGTVRRQEQGWLLFAARQPFPGFVKELGRLAMARSQRAEGLEVLRGARFVVLDADGEVSEREHEPWLWNLALPAPAEAP